MLRKDMNIYLYGSTKRYLTHPIEYKMLIREMVGLELLIQKGIMVQQCEDRLKELSKKFK